jgi:hypothetical protein
VTNTSNLHYKQTISYNTTWDDMWKELQGVTICNVEMA